MGVLGDILNAGVGVANLGYQIGKDQHLTGAQREANAYASRQAEIARDWQEGMYQRYMSPSAQISSQISGMEANGINPAVMFGSSPTSGGSIPGTSSPGSVTPSGGDVSGAIGMIAQLSKLTAEIENINADTRQKQSVSTGYDIENAFKPDILRQDLEQGRYNIDNTIAAIEYTKHQLENVDADTAVKLATEMNLVKEGEKLDAETARERLGFYLDQADLVIKKYQPELMKSQEYANRASASHQEASARFVDSQTLEKQIDNEVRQSTGYDTRQGALGNLLGVGAHFITAITNDLKANKEKRLARRKRHMQEMALSGVD